MTSNIPEYKVSGWETFAIAAGAGLLMVLSALGVGTRFLINMVDPVRAEAMATSLMVHQLPGGTQGTASLRLSDVKIALVSSKQYPEDIRFVIARIPARQESDRHWVETLLQNSFLSTSSTQEAGLDSALQVTSTQTQQKLLCGQQTPVTVSTGKMRRLSRTEPGIRYQAKVTQRNEQYLVMLMVVDNDARPIADRIFSSLMCR